MANATTKGQGAGQGGQGQGDAATLAGRAQDMLGQAGSAISGAAGQAGQAIGGAATAAGKRADDLAGQAGQGAQSLAHTLRDQGPREGYLGQASGAVATGLEQAGKYLEDKHLSGMAGDFGSLIKSHPIPAVLIGIGVGFLLGRALRD
jgi:hypothetical protein